MSALLQFEDFSAPRAATARHFTADDLAAEYQRGLSDGAAQSRNDTWDELCALLERALSNAGDEARIRRRSVTETVSAITPVLQAVALKLASAPCDRLTDQLATELEQLCLAGIAPTCRISGGVDLIERLGNRIEMKGLQGVTLLPGARTEITFDGGRITVDPDDITAQIGRILAEISPSMED